MRNTFKLLFFSFILSASSSSAQNWLPYSNPQSQVEFELPTTAMVVDSLVTLHTILYSSEVDSILALQVHVFDSAYLNADEELFAVALQENDGNELRAIAQIFLMATNSELISLQEITNNLGYPGIEIGIDYQTLEADYPAVSFIQYFLVNNKFVAFSISGSEDDMPRLLSYKDQFFTSINFY
ncbi:MAG TPA: hypothetical protein PL009_03550 [Flavipsychrobacter sp.]|nr:hypothetical protein [Flavipsychrobacter sp.]